MVVVARRCRGRRGRVDGWGVQRPVWGGGVPPYGVVQGMASGRGWMEERVDARTRMREASKGRLVKRRGIGRAKAEAPVTARYGSLGDRCRYRVAVSPESVRTIFPYITSRSLSSRSGGMESGPLLPSSRGRASAPPARSLVRSRHYHRQRGASGRPMIRARRQRGSIDRAKHGGITTLVADTLEV